MLLVMILYMLLASTFIIGKAAIVYSQPIFLIGLRMLFGGMLLLGYIYFFNKKRWIFNKKDIWLFVQIAFFHIYLSFILEFWSYKYVTASKISFMYNLSPFITVLFAYLFFGERMNMRKWTGLIIGFLGSLPVLMAEAPAAELQAGSFYFISVPEIALLISATSGVYGWIILKELVVHRGYSPVLVNGVGMFFGGVAALITSFGFEGKPLLKCPGYSMDTVAQSQSWLGSLFCISWPNVFLVSLYIVLLIVIANVIFYNFYGLLLKKYTPTFLSLAGLLCPLFVALLGWVFLGETVTWHFFVSLAVVLLGAYIFYQDELIEQGTLDQEMIVPDE